MRAYPAANTTFTLTVFNTAAEPLSVHAVGAIFCGSDYIFFKPDDGTSIEIPPHGSHAFSHPVFIREDSPTEPSGCEVRIDVLAETASEGGGPGSGWSYLSQILLIPIDPFRASIDSNPSSGNAPVVVHFAARVRGGLPPRTYKWIFGDGSTATGLNASHAFDVPGTYSVQLVVTDARGNETSDRINLVVGERPWVFPALVIAGGIVAGVLVVVLTSPRRRRHRRVRVGRRSP